MVTMHFPSFFLSFFHHSRVVLIFRVRSARKLAITDSVLLRRLAVIVLLYTSYLTVWMVIQPPSIESSITADKLKYDRCSTSSFSHMILAGKQNILNHVSAYQCYSLWPDT